MSRQLFRGLLVLTIVALTVVGGLWAVRPFLNPPRGLHPVGWTHAQLIRERYPFHLIDPNWLSDDMYWSFAETGARAVIVVLGIILLFALIKSIHPKNTTPEDD